MKILLTGATGYIGKRLLPVLAGMGHEIVCAVRDRNRLHVPPAIASRVEVIEVDFLSPPDPSRMPKDIDAAYYLVHSMMSSIGNFQDLEQLSAEHFREYMERAGVKQVIYLGGIANQEKLSEHLASRKNVESILQQGPYATTVIRAGIIVGSGSASFEIIRDLVEKLPFMITPKWVLTRTQPIAVRDILKFLTGVLMHPECLDRSFDVGGPGVLTYKEMLLLYAEVRGLKRHILTVPVMTPRLSSYWLYFVTSTSYKLAVNLVDSMKIEVVTEDRRLEKLLGIEPISYREAVRLALDTYSHEQVFSSWKDSLASSRETNDLTGFQAIPEHGCITDRKTRVLPAGVREEVLDRIWSIGGEKGWYYANWLWGIRGFLDKIAGGVGLRRGRTHPSRIHAGDSLDFWRVLVADRKTGRLLLFAEMKLPGEAWLEFSLSRDDQQCMLIQTATFRPRGLWGRVYWFLLKPFHRFIFKGMIDHLAGIRS